MMDHNTYIQNLYTSFIQDYENISDNIMFIKHYNTFEISLEELENKVGDMYREGLYYHRYSKNGIIDPYEPFVTAINYYYKRYYSLTMSEDEFVEKCNVYSMHRQIFSAYLKNEQIKRKESLIISEVPYEKQKFVESIVNCLDYIGKSNKILFVLDRIQFAGYSSLVVVKKIVDNIQSCSFKMLVVFDEVNQPLPYVEDIFKDLVKEIEDKSLLYEWDGEEGFILNDYHNMFVPNARYFEDYVFKLNKLLQMLALEDVDYYCDVINNRIVQEKVSVSNNEKFDFYSIRSISNIYNGNINGALLSCEKLVPLYDRSKDLYKDYVYYFISATIQMTMIQSELSERYAGECIRIAKKLDNEELVFLAEVLAVTARFCGWKDVFTVDFTNVAVDEKMAAKLRDNEFYNTLAYYLVYGHDNDRESNKKVVESGCKSEEYEEGIRLGRMLGNNNFLLSAFTKSIVIFTDNGFQKFVDQFYLEKLKILESEKNVRRQANLYIGMGYNAIVSEQFNKANDYFISAISILYKLKNADTIAEALYNMSINCMCTGNYELSALYLQHVFKMVKNLGFETIQICHESKLHGLLAVSYFRTGNDYRTYRCLSKMELIMAHVIEDNSEVDLNQWCEDLYLYYILKAMISRNDGDYVEAYKFIQIANKYYHMCIASMFYNVYDYVTENVAICRLMNRNEDADKYLAEGIKFCRDRGYILTGKRILLTSENKNNKYSQLSLNLGDVTLEQMLDLSVVKGKDNQLVDRKRDITFLSAWQEMINRDEEDEQALVVNALSTMQNYFNLDGILIVYKKDGKYNKKFSSSNIEVDDDMCHTIFTFFEKYRREFIVSRSEKAFAEYSVLTDLFPDNTIVTLIGIPRVNDHNLYSVMLGFVNMHRNFRRNRILLDNENLVIMKTAYIQLDNDLERVANKKNIVAMNDKLQKLAVTDMLTGLFNRQGLAKMLEEDVEFCDTFTILYADLDNFKYYNDTFGHDIGDKVLIEFARIFTKVSKGFGYAVRYGGDEFLVILKNADKNKIFEVADQIYEEISDGFANMISEYINDCVTIPKEHKISCSIGIASTNVCTYDNIVATLQKADEAMYSMKKGSKGDYIFWEDMKHE